MAIISRAQLGHYLQTQIIKPEDRVKKGSMSDQEGQYSTETKVELRSSTGSTWIFRTATSGRISCLWKPITVGYFISTATEGPSNPGGKDAVVFFKTLRETMKEWAFAPSAGKWYLDHKDRYDTCLLKELVDEVLGNQELYPEQLVKTVFELGKIETSPRDQASILKETWGKIRRQLIDKVDDKLFDPGNYFDKKAKDLANGFNKYIPDVRDLVKLDDAIQTYTQQLLSLATRALPPGFRTAARAIIKGLPNKVSGKAISQASSLAKTPFTNLREGPKKVSKKVVSGFDNAFK